jgi:hypothetical protein
MKRRMTIIRRVNEIIDRISELDEKLSFKKVVKILNLCQIFVPLAVVKANNSTDFSLNIKDLIELGNSKEKYKRYVGLQVESLEFMV